MLGSTVGSLENGKYTATNLNLFGNTLDNGKVDKYTYFTGKPNVEGLGYAFLFRNYRPELAKWQTSDPLGYPDGWNNFAYVNNGVTNSIDWLGGEIKASGSTTFNNFVNAVVNTASSSNTSAGQMISTLNSASGGSWPLYGDTAYVSEYSGTGSTYWPTCSYNQLTGNGSSISTGMYTYQYNSDSGATVTRDHVFALLHELLHAADWRDNGVANLDDATINNMVTTLINDSATVNGNSISTLFANILTTYPSQGTVIHGQGLQE